MQTYRLTRDIPIEEHFDVLVAGGGPAGSAAAIEVRFFPRVIDAEAKDRRIEGAVISNVEGYRFIRAKAFIDATGDAALSDLAGADCKIILRDIEAVAPSTLCSLFAGMNWDDPAYGDDWRGIDKVKAFSKKQLHQAIADGHFSH